MVLTDDDVRAAPPELVVAAVREALLRFGRGELLAPARVRAPLGELDYVFTAGAFGDGSSGFRAYRASSSPDRPPGEQLVAVWDPEGQISGIVVGNELGARRTGALGAVAADVLARPDAAALGVVGTGAQAWAQLWALTAVRRLRRVRVWSRDAVHRESFAERARAELGLDAVATSDAATAVRDADLVVLATRSTQPVIEAGDITPGAHVTTVGPKSLEAHETPLALVEAASVVACDFPAQAAAHPSAFFTGSLPLVSLADVLLGVAPGRQQPHHITLFASVGLAGSEVLVAQRLLTRAAALS